MEISLRIQERYTREFVRETNTFDNVIFEIQNEPWSDRPAPGGVIGSVHPFLQPPARAGFPNTVELTDDLSLTWQARVAEWITSEEASLPNKHLIARNYSNFRFPIRQLLPGVSVANFHYAYPEAVLWNYGRGKAISYDETGFMGRDDDSYLRQAGNFMLSGGGIFDRLDYSFSPGHEEGTNSEPNGPGGGSDALKQQFRVLSDFLQSYSLADLRPDDRTVEHAGGTIARVLSNSGQDYSMYFDGDGPAKVTLDLPAGHYTGAWVNVRTGAFERPEHIRSTGGVLVFESPAFANGIALRLKGGAP